ncbi:MAG: peptidase [Proteobacteria bacterium]|nr:peptidase [Pseudomonadota bacterium]
MQSGTWGEKALASRYTALVDLDGEISAESNANADNIIQGLRDAFEAKAAVGVILQANSPGGSPVQSAYIYDEILRLREKYPDKPLYAVIGDVCASGCYYAVAAADKIYASPASIVGSIGVLMDGFGFVDGMKKLGIERRLLTAGENKGMLDPFSPLDSKARHHAQKMLDEIHGQFIDAVKQGRGDALKPNKEIFSGLFWSGTKAKELGLVDEYGSAGSVARDVIGAEEIVDYTVRENLFHRLAERFGMAMGRSVASELHLSGRGLR